MNKSMMNVRTTIVVAITMLGSQWAMAHWGGWDKQGGHNDRKNGGYHCHKEPCFTIHRQSAKAVNDAVTLKRAFRSVYDRNDWKHWSDFDGDCMNTRHEVLAAQADGPTKRSPDGCYVSTGAWNDPFSGKTLTRASDLDIDHVVPLKWASDHGGNAWSAKKKERFTNDPLNLLAVDDALNQAKGARGPDEWLPPNHAFRCEYLQLWQQVLRAYPTLKMQAAEYRVFSRQLAACSN